MNDVSEKIGMVGKWTIESKNILTGETRTYEYNTLVQGFFTAIHRFLSQDQLIVENNELNLTHVGFGLGLTSAVRADSQLENEYSRNDLTAKSFTDLVYTVNIFLDSGDANPAGDYIKELGIFANATGLFNSGTMISRANVNIQKNSNISLNLKWELRG